MTPQRVGNSLIIKGSNPFDVATLAAKRSLCTDIAFKSKTGGNVQFADSDDRYRFDYHYFLNEAKKGLNPREDRPSDETYFADSETIFKDDLNDITASDATTAQLAQAYTHVFSGYVRQRDPKQSLIDPVLIPHDSSVPFGKDKYRVLGLRTSGKAGIWSGGNNFAGGGAYEIDAKDYGTVFLGYEISSHFMEQTRAGFIDLNDIDEKVRIGVRAMNELWNTISLEGYAPKNVPGLLTHPEASRHFSSVAFDSTSSADYLALVKEVLRLKIANRTSDYRIEGKPDTCMIPSNIYNFLATTYFDDGGKQELLLRKLLADINPVGVSNPISLMPVPELYNSVATNQHLMPFFRKGTVKNVTPGGGMFITPVFQQGLSASIYLIMQVGGIKIEDTTDSYFAVVTSAA
jgi:hypothetical protein